MKRDMDLVRLILFEVEKNEKWDEWKDIKIEGYSQEEIYYHIMLLNEAGLIEAKILCDGGKWVPYRLTWNGHEFLDASRNETVWKKVKGIMANKGGSFAFEVVKSLVISVSLEMLKHG
ncbi:MAG: DUF2513 domain-containing protein [Fibrobacter sp.]|nr:DUF2513 domain-containing protein [Fibrobacter sp.]